MSMVGDRLRSLREDADLTQNEMAQKLGIKRATYAKYETGENPIPGVIIIKLADFHGVTTDYLYCRTNDPAPHATKKVKTNPEEYVLSAKTLADAAIRVAEMFEDYQISEADFLKLHQLAYKKFGLPPARGSEKAAHLEHDIPATGVFEDDDKNESKR